MVAGESSLLSLSLSMVIVTSSNTVPLSLGDIDLQ